MILSRTLLTVVGASLLLAGGCTSRQDKVLIQELRAENARLTQELNSLQDRARDLETERNYAREENMRLREQAEGLSRQLAGLGTGSAQVSGFEANPRTGGVSADSDLFFKSGSADVTAEGVAALGQLAQVLNTAEYADAFVTVEGHTDSTPVSRPSTKSKFGDNWGLSAMRAAAVIRVLQSKGIASERLRGAFRGQYNPAVSGTSGDAKAKNRRVEIFLSL